MSLNAVESILEKRLALIWGSTTPISWDNVRRNSIPGQEFIRAMVDGIGSENIALNCRREFYIFTVQVLTMSQSGSRYNSQLCDIITSGFDKYQEGYLLCTESYAQRVGEEKQWFQRNVYINLQYDNYNS